MSYAAVIVVLIVAFFGCEGWIGYNQEQTKQMSIRAQQSVFRSRKIEPFDKGLSGPQILTIS